MMTEEKFPAKVDVAVALLFFTRTDSFEKVFAAVREARPTKLFLYQDGPRGEHDLPGIEACRKIADDIDWQCEVYRNYQERNQGCDPSNYLCQKWAFSLVDKCIFLEDDSAPSQSFFPFCKELLDRYENDERIALISGFNTDEVTPDVPDDYFFTSVQSIWGWASWRHVFDRWDADYSFLKDDYNMKQLRALCKRHNFRASMIDMARDHSESGKEYYETIMWADMLLNSGLAIMPTKNLINNLGAVNDSTHFSALSTMNHRMRRIFTMQRHELEFPLKHPKYVIENVEYKERNYKIHAWNHPGVKVMNSLEELYLNLRHGNFSFIAKSMKRRLQKWTGTYRHS